MELDKAEIKKELEDYELWIDYLEAKDYRNNEIHIAKGWVEALNWALNTSDKNKNNELEIQYVQNKAGLIGDD